MKIKVIEKFIKGKLSNNDCEDNIFIGKNYLAVIDGATSSNYLKIDGKLGGKFLSDFIIEVLEEIDKKLILCSHDLINLINQKIRDKYF